MQKWRRLLADGLLTVNRLVGSERPSGRMFKGSALVFAPHPDDEVLGCGGTIALKVRAGARVNVVVMTDGRASHSALIAANELIEIRRAEAQNAALRLGLSAEDYRFLDFEDHRLLRHRKAASDQVFEIIQQFEPDEIYLPHRRDVITDHVETNRIVRGVVNQIGNPVTLFEYPVWLWNNWPWTLDSARYGSGMVRDALGAIRDAAEIVFVCRDRVNVASVLTVKLAALGAYQSQLQRLNGSPRWSVLADVAEGEFLRRFETSFEIFRRTDYRP